MDLFQPASGTPSSDGVDPEAASEADSDVGNAPGILSHASDPLSGLTQGQLPATEEPAGGAALDAPTETDAPNPPPADPSARHTRVGLRAAHQWPLLACRCGRLGGNVL